MSLQSKLAVTVGRLSYRILHDIFHRGSSLPGKIAYRLDPQVLSELGKNYRLIIVTGTNGKTLTTALISKVLATQKIPVLTNPTGSNMVQGIVSAFLASSQPKDKQKPVAVLEVDEANVKPICEALKPQAFVLTNIFRDQMDRYGEIYTTYEKILAGIKLAPQAEVYLNADAAIFNSQPLPNPKIYYGFSDAGQTQKDFRAKYNVDGILCPKCHHILHYHMLTYANLGSYFCPHCGFQRQEPDYQVTKVQQALPNQSTFDLDGTSFHINIGGIYNIYNALAAYSVGRHWGIAAKQIAEAFQQNEQVFGRQEVLNLASKQVTIILVKNPVGLNEVLATLKSDPGSYSLAFALNANYADGIDTSWIWDGDFEELPFAKITKVITGGEREHDINFRFQVAGVNPQKIISQPKLSDFITTIKQQPNDKVYLLTTYTAMLQLRKKLISLNYIQTKDLK